MSKGAREAPESLPRRVLAVGGGRVPDMRHVRPDLMPATVQQKAAVPRVRARSWRTARSFAASRVPPTSGCTRRAA